MNLFWVFALVAPLIFGMLMLPRGGYLRWGWNLLLILLVVYLGLYHLSGSPRSACMISMLTNLNGDYAVLWSKPVPELAIYLLIKPEADATPVYIETRWSPLLYQELATATMNAQKTGGVIMVRADILSNCTIEPTHDMSSGRDQHENAHASDKSGRNAPKHGAEDGMPAFYAKPVETPPEKLPPMQEDIEVH